MRPATLLSAACVGPAAGFAWSSPHISAVTVTPALRWPHAASTARGRCSARHALRMGVDAEVTRKWTAFSEWAKEQGIQSENVKLAEFDAGLRGVAAGAAIASGDTVISVPAASVLRVIGGSSRIPAKLQGYVSEQTWRDAEWWGQLALLLLWERGAGRAPSSEPSKLSRWIDVLPQAMNTPLHWTEAEVEELQYEPLVTKCIRQRTAWKVLLKQVQKDNPDIGESEFYLACEMARSRAFSGPFVNRLPKDQFFLTGLLVAVSTQLNIIDTVTAAAGSVFVLLFVVGNALLVPRLFGLTHYVMAPMIDMVNHNGKPGAAAGVTYQALQSTFDVLATKPYALGDQVYISYGERSNDQLLQYYGFVETNNVNDAYELVNFPRRIADACSKLSISAPGLDSFAATASTSPTLLSPTGFDPSLIAELRGVCGGDTNARAILRQLLQDELARFPTSLEADEVQLSSPAVATGGDSPAALALTLRIEKKRLLSKNIAALGP